MERWLFGRENLVDIDFPLLPCLLGRTSTPSSAATVSRHGFTGGVREWDVFGLGRTIERVLRGLEAGVVAQGCLGDICAVLRPRTLGFRQWIFGSTAVLGVLIKGV
jgi:hypothetical protein